MATVHLKVLIDGAGTIEDFLEAAVKAASDAVDRGTASVLLQMEAECGWQNVVSGEDHINVVINSPSALALLHKDRPAKRLKFGQSYSSMEVSQAASTADAFEFQSALITEDEPAPPPALDKPAVEPSTAPSNFTRSMQGGKLIQAVLERLRVIDCQTFPDRPLVLPNGKLRPRGGSEDC